MKWAILAIIFGLYLLLAALTSPVRALKIFGILIWGAIKVSFVLLIGVLTLGAIGTHAASRDGSNHVPVAGPRIDI